MKLFIDFTLVTGILFCSFILFTLIKKKEQYGKVMIVLFVLILSVLVNYYGYLHKLIYLVLPTLALSNCINVLAGPLFLIYIKSLYTEEKNIFSQNFIHFVFPSLYTLFVCIPPAINYGLKNKLLDRYFDIIDPFHSLSITYSLIYCVISLKLLYQFRNILKKNYSNLDNKDLKWMEFFLIGSILVIFIDLLTTGYDFAFGENEWSQGYLTAIALVFLMIYLGYYGITQSRILLPKHLFLPEITPTAPLNSSPKEETVKKEPISDSHRLEMIAMKKSLIDSMKTQKPYLNEDLTLRILANILSISDKKLSALLNQFMNTSFYDFINSYRIEEAKQKIVDKQYQHYTLLAIGFESGFKSKTSFNRIFKSVTGLSPSEYKKKHVSNPK